MVIGARLGDATNHRSVESLTSSPRGVDADVAVNGYVPLRNDDAREKKNLNAEMLVSNECAVSWQAKYYFENAHNAALCSRLTSQINSSERSIHF